MTNLKLKYSDLLSFSSGQRLSLEEAREYEVVFDGVTESCQIYWDGALLAPDSQGSLSIKPGQWVGDTELRIERAGESLLIPVRVQPREEKLSDSLWITMLQDLEVWLPGVSVGIEGGRSGQVDDAGVSAPLIAEALIPIIASFERAIRNLLEFPRRLDVSILDDVPLRMVRRVDRETLNWVSRHPDFSVHLDPWKSMELTEQQPTLPRQKTVDILDHPVNRYISWLIRRVEKVLRITADGLEAACTANPTDDNVFWCRSRAKRLRDGADRILRMWRTSFLSDIPREPLTEAAIQVVFDEPTYARVHNIGRLFLNPLFQLDLETIKTQASVRPSYTIYELWCFLTVGEQLKQVLPKWKLTTAGMNNILGFSSTGEGAIFKLTNQHNQEIEILFNATFAGYFSRIGKKRWSISGERRPDIVVNIKNREGEGRWVALDAKYRVGRSNLADAFSSAHVYHDSLRYEGYGGSCKAAVLLSPSRSDEVGEWYSDKYRETYNEGIFECKPGSTNTALGEWLVKALRC